MMRVFLLCLIFCTAGSAAILDDANDCYAKGKMSEALGLYKKALHEGENPTLCYFNCANAYYRMDSISQAIVNAWNGRN